MSKKFLAGVFAVALFAVASVASAYDFGATTLRVGSRGEAVKNVQIVVGATPVDGIFGNITKAKVMAWQASNGLVADGLFGAMSKAKANTGTVPVVGGTLCPNGMLLSNNCNAPETTTPSTLKGAEGDITVTKFTSGTETKINEGKSEKALGIRIKADNGSDVAINTMRVVIDNPIVDSGETTRLERYIDGINIYQGSKKVGSADVSEFSRNSATYTKSVSLSNAVVKADGDEKFYVEIIANTTISSELQNNKWDVSVDSVRFTDAMGVVTTENSFSPAIKAQFNFGSATENDKITSTSSSSNPEATTLKVSTSGTSDEHMVLAFRLRADKDSSDLNVLTLPILVETGTSVVEDVVSEVYFKIGSKVYDDYTLVDGDTDEATYKFEIDEGALEIYADETVEIKVYAKFMRAGLSSTYVTGETVKFSFDRTGMVVENTNGDSVSTTDVSNRNGNLMTLSTSSTTVTGVTTSSTVDSDNKVATYTFNFSVDADGADVVLNSSTIVATVSQSVTPNFSIKRESGNATGTLGSNYTVVDGDEASFTVTYTVDPNIGGGHTAGVYYVTLVSVAGISVDKTAGPENIIQ